MYQVQSVIRDSVMIVIGTHRASSVFIFVFFCARVANGLWNLYWKGSFRNLYYYALHFKPQYTYFMFCCCKCPCCCGMTGRYRCVCLPTCMACRYAGISVVRLARFFVWSTAVLPVSTVCSTTSCSVSCQQLSTSSLLSCTFWPCSTRGSPSLFSPLWPPISVSCRIWSIFYTWKITFVVLVIRS